MRVKVLVVEEKTEHWGGGDTGKKEGSADVLICLDRSPKGERLSNTFDFRLGPKEVDLKDKLEGKEIDIIIEDFEENFAGRLKARGRIDRQSVKGLPLPTRPGEMAKAA